MRKLPLPVRSATVPHWRHGEQATKQECQPSPACLGTKGEALTPAGRHSLPRECRAIGPADRHWPATEQQQRRM